MFVIWLPVAFGTLTLVVDVGEFFVKKREAQAAADAGALAAVPHLPDDVPGARAAAQQQRDLEGNRTAQQQ